MRFSRARLVAFMLGAILLSSLSTACRGGNLWFHYFQVKKECCYVPNNRQHSQTLDIYYEKTDKPLPLVVFVHGGGWLGGDKQEGTPYSALNRAGYACASINYRLSSQATYPAQLFDCKAAVRWLRAHAIEFNIDPKRIGVWGVSAGGHLAALLGTTCGVPELEGDEGNLDQSSSVQAVCDWCGPTNLLTIHKQSLPSSILKANDPQGVVAKLLGGIPSQKLKTAGLADPCRYASPDDPPFLILHGEEDNVVPAAQSDELYRALKRAQVEAQLVKFAGAGHSLNYREAKNRSLQFFDQHLKSNSGRYEKAHPVR